MCLQISQNQINTALMGKAVMTTSCEKHKNNNKKKEFYPQNGVKIKKVKIR